MNLRMTLLCLLLSMHLFACQTGPDRMMASDSLQPGGRSGLHGMVIFGKDSYFIEHIPMLHPPHDFQIVASITIKNTAGKILKPDLSQNGFTLKPAANFSLNNFIEGRVKQLSAEIYQGSFEQNGKVIQGLESVTIEIAEILLARQLPQNSSQKFFEVTDSTATSYQTAIITPQNNIQVIKNISKLKTLWCVTGPDFFENCPD